jgi:transposase
MTIAGNGYRYLPVVSSYGGIQQRWLIVHSDHAFEREIKTLRKNLVKARDRNAIDLKHLRNQVFACADAAVRRRIGSRKNSDIRILKLRLFKSDDIA